MTEMTISEYASHAGVNRKTISRWIREGLYVVMSGKKINVEASDENLRKFRDSNDKRISNSRKGKQKPAGAGIQISSADTFEERAEAVFDALSSLDGIRTVEESRAIKEHWLAEMARLEYERESGTLLPWQYMIDRVGEEYARMRTRLVALAPEHGPRLRALASTTTDTGFVAALQELIYEALNELGLDDEENPADTV